LHRACREASKSSTGQDEAEDFKTMRIALLSAAACLGLMACTPVIDQRGYLPDPQLESKIVVGDDTKTTIQQRLGYPSTEATFGATDAGSDAWYYISSIEKTVAFFTPTIEKRAILAVYFDKDGKVTDLKHYGLKDGHIVAFETRTTPAKGRELTFLQQLFNANPGVPLGGAEPQNPGGGGGPGPGGGGGGYPGP
jgi:outer membrane protein assembly factor BamE (lipoprotein component of BamABCDE complex)